MKEEARSSDGHLDVEVLLDQADGVQIRIDKLGIHILYSWRGAAGGDDGSVPID